MEFGSIIKFRNANNVAVLHLSVDFHWALPYHKHFSEMALIMERLFLQLSLSGAKSTNAGR